MSKRKIRVIILGIFTLIVVGLSIFKISIEKNIGLPEIVSISVLLVLLFINSTWSTKKENDGLLLQEELGQKIAEKSAKVAYFFLTLFIFGAVLADKLMHGSINVFLILLMGLSMITLPFIMFLNSRKYK